MNVYECIQYTLLIHTNRDRRLELNNRERIVLSTLPEFKLRSVPVAES